MDRGEMLHLMCSRDLAVADMKAICKSRGFTGKEAASRVLFENFFLSSQGVEAALVSLTKEESVALHLLALVDEPVDVSFFARLYDGGHGNGWYATFTQRYKDIFKRVKSSLIRKGVLLMAQDEDLWAGDTKMARWRFAFPNEFAPFLPPPFQKLQKSRTPGEQNRKVLRDTIARVLDADEGSGLRNIGKQDISLKEGELLIGKRTFSKKRLLEWQRICWEKSASASKEEKSVSKNPHVSPIEALTYALSQLQTDEWVSPDQLGDVLRIFCGEDHPKPGLICERGWRWGCLVRHVGEKTCYRFPLDTGPTADDSNPFDYMQVKGKAPGVSLDLKTISYDSLEFIAGIMRLEVEKNRLWAFPDTVKLGRAIQRAGKHPICEWLRDNSPAFRQCFQEVEQRWGKRIVHENLMIAKINDLSLGVAIQKLFPNPRQLVMLPNGYIAFPTQLLPKIEALVSKSGYVIKTVRPKTEKQ